MALPAKVRRRPAARAPRRAALLLLLACACAAAPPRGAAAGAPKYRIIAYVGARTQIHAVGADKLTHINYAFAHVSPEGEIVLRHPDAPAHLGQLQALKAKNPALKILVSVGGWGADNFSDAALTEASRERFAASAAAIVRRYALDGLDLDWEYPGQPGPGIRHRPEDRENFTLLLAAVRRRLDALSDERGRTGDWRHTLTIATAAGVYFKHTEMEKLHVYVDWINIMTYDFHTAGSKTTGHHTALYRSAAPGATESSAEASVRQHLAAGIPPRKLVVGAAFYGRGWAGVRPENNGAYQPYAAYAGDYSYSKLVREYVNRQGFKRYWDGAAKAPYLWNPATATFISYDDPESLEEKARFVKSRRLGGIMYWEHSHDPGEALLDAIREHLR